MKFWRIKWENIFALVFLVSVTCMDIKIILNEGFDLSIVGCEVIMNCLVAYAIVYVLGTFRKSVLMK